MDDPSDDPEQHHDHPSSSSSSSPPPPPLPPLLPPYHPLQLLTSWAQYQPQGGYPYDFEPLDVPMPGHPGYHYSEASLAPWTSTTNVIVRQNQHQPWANQPHPNPANVFPAPGNNNLVIPAAPVYPPGAVVYAQQPNSAIVFNAPGYNSNPHIFVYHPGAPHYAQPVAATVFNVLGYNSNPHASFYQPGAPLYALPGAANDPYASAGLVAPPANANQAGASRGPVAGDRNRSRPALRNVWANELRNAVRGVRTLDELEAVVDRVIQNHYYNGVPLMEVAAPSFGETALRELVTLVARHLYPGALQQLFRCLVHGWIMEQSNGPELLQHFFTTLGYVHCSIFIDELAIPRFWEMVTSRVGHGHGHRSMMVCLDNASGYTDQGAALHYMFVSNTAQIARDIHGSSFLRTFFQTGSNDQLREHITERVEANLAALSMDKYGNNVVRACFVPSNRMPRRSVRLLRRGLHAFLCLPDDQLWELLQNHCARCVLERLLRTSVHVLRSSEHRAEASEQAMQLAQQILGVGVGGDELNSIARQVLDEIMRRR